MKSPITCEDSCQFTIVAVLMSISGVDGALRYLNVSSGGVPNPFDHPARPFLFKDFTHYISTPCFLNGYGGELAHVAYHVDLRFEEMVICSVGIVMCIQVVVVWRCKDPSNAATLAATASAIQGMATAYSANICVPIIVFML